MNFIYNIKYVEYHVKYKLYRTVYKNSVLVQLYSNLYIFSFMHKGYQYKIKSYIYIL